MLPAQRDGDMICRDHCSACLKMSWLRPALVVSYLTIKGQTSSPVSSSRAMAHSSELSQGEDLLRLLTFTLEFVALAAAD